MTLSRPDWFATDEEWRAAEAEAVERVHADLAASHLADTYEPLQWFDEPDPEFLAVLRTVAAVYPAGPPDEVVSRDTGWTVPLVQWVADLVASHDCLGLEAYVQDQGFTDPSSEGGSVGLDAPIIRELLMVLDLLAECSGLPVATFIPWAEMLVASEDPETLDQVIRLLTTVDDPTSRYGWRGATPQARDAPVLRWLDAGIPVPLAPLVFAAGLAIDEAITAYLDGTLTETSLRTLAALRPRHA